MSNIKQTFKLYLAEQGLKSTRQREQILDEFLRAGAHLSAEDLYLRLRKKFPNIGYATVYRTLKLLAECGIAEERHFGDKQTRYEATAGQDHHDHLVCQQCGSGPSRWPALTAFKFPITGWNFTAPAPSALTPNDSYDSLFCSRCLGAAEAVAVWLIHHLR